MQEVRVVSSKFQKFPIAIILHCYPNAVESDATVNQKKGENRVTHLPDLLTTGGYMALGISLLMQLRREIVTNNQSRIIPTLTIWDATNQKHKILCAL
jgi:hypothetical protein